MISRILLTALLAGVAACATAAPGTRPTDMSADEHREHAERHAEEADEHAGRYQASAELAQPPTTLWIPNGTRVHLQHAASHDEHSRQHLAAAGALEDSEEQACQQAPASSRSACPLASGVERIDALPDGARLHLAAGADRPAILSAIRCHRAHAATAGFDGMAGCPLYLDGIEVREGAGEPWIDLVARDATTAVRLQELVRALQ